MVSMVFCAIDNLVAMKVPSPGLFADRAALSCPAMTSKRQLYSCMCARAAGIIKLVKRGRQCELCMLSPPGLWQGL